MKKAKIYAVSRKAFLTNFIIVMLVFSVSIMSYFCVNLTAASKIVRGVYYSGNENSNRVSLMINVYWGTEYIDEILQVLHENDVKTTFFVGGLWVAQNPDVLTKIYDAGHEIGNHGYSHKNHKKLSTDANFDEISRTNNVINAILGKKPTLFAPPSGEYGRQTVEVANSLGMQVIMWTYGRDTIDWRDKDDVDAVYSRAVKNCKGGDFVLMHPTFATAKALPKIITKMKQECFELCPVSENLRQK